MKIRRFYTCLYTPPRPSGFDPRFGPDAPSFERICTRFFENSIFEKSSTKSIGLFNGNRRVSRVPMVALGGRAKFKIFWIFAPPLREPARNKKSFKYPYCRHWGVLKIFCCAAELAPPPGGGQGSQLTCGPLDLFFPCFSFPFFVSVVSPSPFFLFPSSLLFPFPLFPFLFPS